MTHEIRVKRHLIPDCSEWLDGMRIIHSPDGESRQREEIIGTIEIISTNKLDKLTLADSI